MRVSIVIATYNGERFIEEQMNSILSQTRKPDEVIISDDGSKDNTLKIVKKYIVDNNLQDTWKVYVNSENKGYAKNFIDASKKAKGDIIYFCDQDDIWITDRLEKMSQIMENNKNINLLCSNLEPFYYDRDTRKWNKKELSLMKTDNTLEKVMFCEKTFHLQRSGCTMCIRKQFLDIIMPFWRQNWAHDDFVWKMAILSSSCFIFHHITLKRRMHSNNATIIRCRTREWRVGQLLSFKEQYRSLIQFANIRNIKNEDIEIIKRNIKAIEIRLKVVQECHLYYWPILAVKYRFCYPRIKGLYLDVFLAVFKQYRGV